MAYRRNHQKLLPTVVRLSTNLATKFNLPGQHNSSAQTSKHRFLIPFFRRSTPPIYLWALGGPAVAGSRRMATRLFCLFAMYSGIVSYI